MSMTRAVIFDLDGVVVSTDDYHYDAWEKVCMEEKIDFNREINHRLRGISRMESLAIILEKAEQTYSEDEKVELTNRKNNYYQQKLKELSKKDLLPGVLETLKGLKQKGIKIAIGSSSKNTPIILNQIGLDNYFDAVADGNEITNSKPNPEVFLLAANKLGIDPESCIVVEDAVAGIEAAHRGQMRAVAVGDAINSKKAEYNFSDITELLSLI